MSTNDVAPLILVLLPGFISVQFFNWTSHKRKASDFETLLWMLIAALATLAPVLLLWHEADGNHVPSLGSVVRNPSLVPMRVAITLYGLSVPLGWLAGLIDNNRILEPVALKFGIDLTRRHDVWFVAFRDSFYIIVYLKSGNSLYGWPTLTTTTRDGTAAEIYLERVHDWNDDVNRWVPRTGIVGAWVEASSIDRIDFTERPGSNPVGMTL